MYPKYTPFSEHRNESVVGTAERYSYEVSGNKNGAPDAYGTLESEILRPATKPKPSCHRFSLRYAFATRVFFPENKLTLG